jgi:hypothetical protein
LAGRILSWVSLKLCVGFSQKIPRFSPELVFTELILQILYWICANVKMPENHRFMMGYEYQDKKKEIY